MKSFVLGMMAVMLSSQISAWAQVGAPADIPESFTLNTESHDYIRQEVMIPMRDGVKLFTEIIIPKNVKGLMPIVLTRTPYSAAKSANNEASPHATMALQLLDETLVQNGYIRVIQDVRGKYKSEGDYTLTLPPRGPLNARTTDQSTDTWDTIDWLVKNIPDNNGRVGVMGISYSGWTTLMALLNPHPALKAAIPMNALVDGWMGDDWYHNGAFRQMEMEYMYRQTTVKGDQAFFPYGYRDLYTAYLKGGSAEDMARRHGIDKLPAWRRLVDNPACTAYWQNQAVDKLLENVPLTVPTMTVHGLFDQEDIYGPIATYKVMESKDKKNDKNFLVIGPWFHGQHKTDGSSLGPINWRSDTSYYFRTKVMQPFFDLYLKDKKPEASLPPVLAFETGTNEWKYYSSWPSKGVAHARLYLQDKNSLAFATSGDEKSYDEYVSDPSKPVPYRVPPLRVRYATDSTWKLWLVDDQRPFTSRTDVLTYVTEPLTEAVTVKGEVIAQLVASTSGTDSDWVVKLIDVYPDEYALQPELGGYELMISADIFRGRYRESFEVAKPIAPGQPLPYRVRLPHANHSFLPGHRIMVQIQSSLFPLYDRNPQTFVDNIAFAKPEAYQKATQRIYHNSYIDLPLGAPGK